MDQDPKPIENDEDLALRAESKQSELETGVEKLERPPKGDFIAGLRSFAAWVKSLIEK
ncbi:MAG TPA: hypothetical protein VF974_02485 [Patescibacteria group bacterium]